MWDENDHPRDKDGKFTDGNGQSKSEKVAEAERIYNSDLPDVPTDDLNLSKQEYAVLRQEVMRKNSVQKGKVKPTNFAYTSNYFYVYSTTGGDSFAPIVQLDIEKDRKEINYWLTYFGG